MRWILNIEGGPKRVNHAAVEINKKIYSFGGYCSGTKNPRNEAIDIHVLNTATLRWTLLPYNIERPILKESIKSNHENEIPYTRARARSVAELHPLGQLRFIRPPLSGSSSTPLESSMMYDDDSIDSEELANIEISEDDNEFQVDDIVRHEEHLQIDDSDYEDDHNVRFYESVSSSSLASSLASSSSSSEYYSGLLSSSYSEASGLLGNDEEAKRSKTPYMRYGHTVVAYMGKAYLWGGRNDVHGSSDVLHEYNPVTNTWSIVPINGDLIPPARDGHTAIVNGDFMYIFGGFEDSFQRFSQETYSFNFVTRTWQRLYTTGELPQHRDFHTACVLNHNMYIFGGRSDEMGQFHSNSDIYCSKIYSLNLKTHVWTQIKTTGNGPCGRRSHSVWAMNNYMYLFGGYDSKKKIHFDDLYEFNPLTNTWREIFPTNAIKKPFARRRHCSIKSGNRIYIFGGTMPNPNSKKDLVDLSDLCILDFASTLVTLCCEEILRSKISHKNITKYLFIPEILINETSSTSNINNTHIDIKNKKPALFRSPYNTLKIT